MLKSSSKRDGLPIIFVLLVLACLVAGYWPILEKLNLRWTSDDNSYCYLVAPLFLYLCWEKKDFFRFGELNWSLLGVVPGIVSVFLIIAGELASVETLLYFGLWGCVASFMFSMYGWRIRHLFFPLLILLFIVPMPPFINRMLTFQMKLAASTLSVEMLRAAGVSVLQDGNILDLGVNKLQVVDACSGLRYIVSMLLMSLLIGHFFSNGLWRKIVLVLLVYPLSIFINAVRIFLAGILTVNDLQHYNEGAYHDAQGTIAFLVAGAILFFVAKILQKIGTIRKRMKEKDEGAKSLPFGRPLFVALFFCLLFGGSGWALQNMASTLTIPERTTFKSFPMEIAGWQGERNYLSQGILDELWADDYVNAVFTTKGRLNSIYLLIPYYEYQGTRHTAHAPQSCLLGGGWALESNTTRKMSVAPGKDIEVGMLILKKGDMKMLASYFFFQRGRVISSPWWNKFYLMWDAFRIRRTDGALVRVEMTVAPGQDVEDAEKQLEAFLAGLWPLLPEYIPQ